MSKRLLLGYCYLGACVLSAVACVVIIATGNRALIPYVLIVAVPLWIGGLVWNATRR